MKLLFEVKQVNYFGINLVTRDHGYLATDPDGGVHWYYNAPKQGNNEWENEGDVEYLFTVDLDTRGWKSTLFDIHNRRYISLLAEDTIECENCGIDFFRSDCGTSFTENLFECPHCEHQHVVPINFNSINFKER